MWGEKMPDVFGNVQQQLNDFWQGLDNAQKTKLISVVAISLLIISVGVYAITRPSYIELYIGLDTKDMAEVTQKLDEVKIKYKVSDNMSNLLVAKSEKVKAQMELARANLPSGDAKYADAYSSNTSFGATESDKKRDYIEYKSKEIARTLINNSSSISTAEVFLNIADGSNFFSEENTSTASVKIKPNGELSPSQIEGIARFVANSVSELDPKNVEVVDNEMNILKDFDDPTIAGADRQYNLAQTKKKNLEKEIKNILANNSSEYDDVKVVANLVLDFNTMTEDGKKYEPVIDGSGAVISQSEKIEELVNGTNGGVPGTDGNDGTTTYPSDSATNDSSYKNSDVTKNFVYDEKVYQTSKALGQPVTENSSIAVSLYYGDKIENAPTKEVIDKVTNVVRMASGLALDKISVQSFKTTKEIQTGSSANIMIYVKEYGIFAISLILVGLLGYAVFTGSTKTVKYNNEVEEIVVNTRNTKRHLEEIRLGDNSESKSEIDKFIKQKPEAVAQLLRNWLTEDWE